jgi:hypothetical protein
MFIDEDQQSPIRLDPVQQNFPGEQRKREERYRFSLSQALVYAILRLCSRFMLQ